VDLLAILPAFNGGGAERVLLNIASGLARAGKTVAILVFDPNGPLADQVAGSIGLQSLGTRSLRESLGPMVRAIRRRQPRVVFSTLGYVNVAILASRFLLPSGTRVWVREANLPSISLPNNRHHRLMRLAYRLLYRRADLVICSSIRMRDELVGVFQVPASRIRILPNPVDEGRLRSLALPMTRLPGPGPRFVALGRLTRQKGFDRLLNMFAGLGIEEARLSILGDGPMRDELVRLAATLGISARVSFLGFDDRPWSHVAGADALLLPSRWEGMPNAALEALVCGVPVIATPESGGISEVAEQAQFGAVTVAEAGPDFIAAMRRVSARSETSLRPSLLPPAYRMASVIDRFEEWLDFDA
jgi:glycosyltransferase involved in cell wall biosynthesis